MAERGEIVNGDEVKDIITGLSGVVVAITNWFNGCQRITVQPREIVNGKPVESSTFDIEQLEVVKQSGKPPTGMTSGPSIAPVRQPDMR